MVRSVPEKVAAAAAAHGDVTAAIWQGDRLTFEELHSCALALAEELGAGPGRRVALLMRPSLRRLAAMLAVWYSGAALCPLDPDDPPGRVERLLRVAQPHVVVSDAGDVRVPELDVLLDRRSPRFVPRAGGTAYVMFTSGTTGQPKGVVVSHRALSLNIDWTARAFPLTPGEVVLQKTPYTFDVSMMEHWWPLSTGATVVIANHDERADPGAIERLLTDYDVTACHFVPSMLSAYLRAGASLRHGQLRLVLLSGEALARPLADKCHASMHAGAECWNLYGPTEATIHATSHQVRRGDQGPVPIGRPVDGLVAEVIDADGEPVSGIDAGELWLGGPALADGYFASDVLTDARFPVTSRGRRYRTGDLAARSGAGGELVYLGRLDRQLKVRGVRVDPLELEEALCDALGAAEARVVTLALSDGLESLCAGVVLEGLPDDWRERLEAALPRHLIPSRVVALLDLPTTSHGKVDDEALRRQIGAEVSSVPTAPPAPGPA